ncbi:4-hydroxybenzoate polyprenyltransferase [Prochlorococcus marinus]|uniref:4-hydroxybenzoate solanesyltransferase n=1 Tax=Prochlorococcus marinus (strain MIT 9211) TaxID=93059 RepID=A9BE78_PROM4|nr:4-hydroxybenzoate polyprenyltransferase [Prochlorococcus marinus]ABX08388.1 probable 4-hydroxybenzoate-octaprenyltransferase [Prochlorococcus marinus str. MIT 9211]
MKSLHYKTELKNWIHLLRWNKPSGRLILLIPAGWSLWLTPSAPPQKLLIALIITGGIFTSAAGCIANDLWDINLDSKVKRTKNRPLASGKIKTSTAWGLLVTALTLSLLIVLLLPGSSRVLCLQLASASLIPILIYPSSKRWFKYPQALLALCWGFSVLIPWAASESSLSGGWPLISCWLATMTWTFGFDTVYAMADKNDDKNLGLHSSVLSLGGNAKITVSICYFITSVLLGFGAFKADTSLVFWPIWLIASIGMQREIHLINLNAISTSMISRHFSNQVLLGSLFLLGLILSKVN